MTLAKYVDEEATGASSAIMEMDQVEDVA